MRLQRIVLTLSLAAFLVTALGGAYLFLLREEEIEESHALADRDVRALADELSYDLTDNQKTVGALAGLTELRHALPHANAAASARADGVLRHFHDALGADICYLMDDGGMVVASSDRGSQDSILRQSYAFRPYFTRAMKGSAAVYMAVGASTARRGVYYSHPVYSDTLKTPAGVAVIKEPVDFIEKKLSDKSFSGIVSVVDPNGIAFVSNSRDLLYHALWKLPPETASRIAGSRQFGDNPPQWAGFERRGHYAVDLAGNRFMIHESTIKGLDGWKVVYLHDLKLLSQTFTGPAFRLISAMIAMFCVLVGITVFILYRMAKDEVILRHRAEESLREERDRARSYLDVAGVMLVVLDAGGMVTMINPKGCDILGRPSEEVIGKKWFETFLPEGERERGLGVFRQLMSGMMGQFEYFENRVIAKDGEQRTIVTHNTVVRDRSGAITGILFSGDDVTLRRRLQEEVQRARNIESIGFLAGGMAHDFNNLLNVILGYISLVKMTMKPAGRISGMLDESEAACRRAAELTGKLITFSKGGEPILEEVSFSEMLTHQCALDCTNVVCEHDMPDDLRTVRADRDQIRLVVKNIFRNACEAMPEGGVVHVSAENIDVSSKDGLALKEGAYVRLSIRDNGPGIPADILPKIFDPYFTSKGMGAERGVGLGLSICYSILKRHGGLITVESRLGAGATFHIYLPAFRQTAA